MTVRVIGDGFTQDAAQTLDRTTHDLTLDQHRVDDDTAIVGNGIALNRDAACLTVHLDDGGMNRIAPGDRWWLPIEGFLKAGVDTRWAFVFPARTRRLRDPGEAHHGAGGADHADSAIAQFKVYLCTFQKIGSDGEDLVP